jgi:hypothetical protein
MTTREIRDSEWISQFNEVSRDFYFHRYVAMFKPKSAISSIILPSDRHEIEIGLNLLSKRHKNTIKSIKEPDQQVLGLVAIIEDSIKYHYEEMKQKLIEKAVEYFNETDRSYITNKNNNNNDNNVAVQLVKFLHVFYDDDFSFEDATKIIGQNEQKYDNDFINRLLGSIVPILVDKREDKEFNKDIKNIAEGFLRHDLDTMIMDVATEKQRLGWTK